MIKDRGNRQYLVLRHTRQGKPPGILCYLKGSQRQVQIDLPLLKLGLIFFWSLWLTLTFITNLFDSLKVWRVLPEDW